jgi:dTDP-4-dehydrorhamnose reductase
MDAVNVDGLNQVVLTSAVFDVQLIFFSSSYVFDGKSQTAYKPTDETYPVNRYGRQKEIIERCIQDIAELKYLIIRTVGVFGEEGKPKNFVSQVVKAVAENRKIYVPTDQTMNPVYAMDLAKVAIHLSDRYTDEIFHVAGDKCISKYDFAIKIADNLGHTNSTRVLWA